MTILGEVSADEWPEALGRRAARQMTISMVGRVVLVSMLVLVSLVRLLAGAHVVDPIPLDFLLLIVLPIEVVAFIVFWSSYLRAKKSAAIEYGVSPASAKLLVVHNRKKFLDSVVRARQRDAELSR